MLVDVEALEPNLRVPWGLRAWPKLGTLVHARHRSSHLGARSGGVRVHVVADAQTAMHTCNTCFTCLPCSTAACAQVEGAQAEVVARAPHRVHALQRARLEHRAQRARTRRPGHPGAKGEQGREGGAGRCRQGCSACCQHSSTRSSSSSTQEGAMMRLKGPRLRTGSAGAVQGADDDQELQGGCKGYQIMCCRAAGHGHPMRGVGS